MKSVVIIILVLVTSAYQAQNLGFTQRLAVDSSDSFVEVNVVSNAGSTVFNRELIQLFRYGGSFTDELKSSVENKLKGINRLGGEFSTSIMYSNPCMTIFKDFGWYVGMSIEQSAGVEFTNDAYHLAFNGTQSFIQDTAWIQRTGFTNQGYKAFTFGLNRSNRLRIGLSVLSYGYYDNALVQKGYVAVDTASQELSANISTAYTQFSTGKASVWNNRGNGVGVNFEWIIPLLPENTEKLITVGVRNFGVYWSKITSTVIDTSYAYSGFELNSFQNLGQTIGTVNLQDTLSISTSESNFVSVMPFDIYCYKLPEPKKLSSIYGFRYRVNNQSIPLIYAGGSLQVGNSGRLSSYVSYGNYTRFSFGVQLQKEFNNGSISLNTTNVGGYFSKKALSQSFNLSVCYSL